MRRKASPAGLLAFVTALVFLALGAPTAQAEFGIARWESLTCQVDASAPGLGNWAANGAPCVKTSPSTNFYTQAAGHPNFGITAFLMNQVTGPPKLPEGFIKDLRTELPVGFGVNPQATEQCTVKLLSEPVAAGPPLQTKCTTEKPGSLVGVDYLTTLAPGPAPPAGTEITIPALVYNVETPDEPSSPFYGSPSMAGFNATGKPTILIGDLDPKDQHISFTIHDIPSPGPPEEGAPIIGSRLVFNGQAGKGYLTLPSECAGPQLTTLDVTSHPFPPPSGPELFDTETFATPYGATECAKVPFEPKVTATVDSKTDSPEPVTVDVFIPFNPAPAGLTNSELRVAKITLPEGAGINPSSANGLAPCTDAQFAAGTNDPIACPAASKIGSIEVETPTLPGVLGGEAYVGQPLNNDASSGEQFRIFLHVTSARFGVNVRLVGNVFPNLQTGQITALVKENPQAPFEHFKVHIDGGPKGVLTTPDTCGPHKTASELTPFSSTTNATTTSEFTLSEAAGGGPCPQTLAARPFAPSYTAASDSTKAGAYSPFRVHIARTDGQQELKAVDVTLPKGLTGKLAGIPYCSDAAIAAAATTSGTAQQASSSCSAESMIGTTTTAAGSGSGPIKVAGKAFLAGPYKGAPLSMAVITPGIAGPYDIGTIVVRVALNVNPETAQVNAVSDPIPNVFGGVKLDIRSIDVNVDRSKFMLNPTNCAAQATSGTISGGGGDPSNPAAFSSYPVNAPYAATGCGKLKFKPTLHTRLYGPTTRAKNPRLRAILEAREGDANVSRAALTLPHSVFLDQAHIKTVCTRPQLASQTCPKAAIYGHAEAKTPLLSKKLKGPVYLVSSNHKLPDLVANLRGQVNIQLHGVISSKRGGIKTVFNRLPDVPVKKFILNMAGGKKSLLVNSTNLCKGRQASALNIKAQNGKRVKNNRLPLKITSCH